MLPIMRARGGLTGAVVALCLLVGSAAQAQVCGNSVVEAGEACDPGPAACTYRPEVTPALVIDCTNVRCTEKAAGTDYVCTEQCVRTPSCQPLLDDPARIVFRARPKLDTFSLTGRTVPLTTMDPAAENVSFLLTNMNGVVYAETVLAGKFIPNTKLDKWKYVLKRNGLPQIYNFQINKKVNRTTGETEFIFKAKSESGLDMTNPAATGQSVDLLKTMTIQINVGDDVFYNTAAWELKSNGWHLADKFMFL